MSASFHPVVTARKNHRLPGIGWWIGPACESMAGAWAEIESYLETVPQSDVGLVSIRIDRESDAQEPMRADRSTS